MCLGKNKFYKQINSFLDVVVLEVNSIHLPVDENAIFRIYLKQYEMHNYMLSSCITF